MKFAVLALITMTGCAQLPEQIASFHIDEGDIQAALKTQLIEQGPITLSQSSVADLAVSVKDIQIDFMAADGGRVSARLDTELTTKVPFVGAITTRLAPAISGGVELREQAIYLVNPRLDSLGYQGPYEQAVKQTLGDNGERLTAALDLYFSEHPVYRLDQRPSTQLFGALVTRLSVDDTGVRLLP